MPDPPVDEPDVVDTVSRLVGKSLVTTVNAPDGLRYQLLGMLRQYGRDRLTERGDAARFQQRLLDWAMSGIEQLESIIGAGHEDAGLAVELLAAADDLRRRTGQGHRPWEIRARLGNLQDRIGIPSAVASAPARTGREYSLSAAALLAVNALQSLATSTAS